MECISASFSKSTPKRELERLVSGDGGRSDPSGVNVARGTCIPGLDDGSNLALFPAAVLNSLAGTQPGRREVSSLRRASRRNFAADWFSKPLGKDMR